MSNKIDIHKMSTIAGIATAAFGFIAAGLELADKVSQAKDEPKKGKEKK